MDVVVGRSLERRYIWINTQKSFFMNGKFFMNSMMV